MTILLENVPYPNLIERIKLTARVDSLLTRVSYKAGYRILLHLDKKDPAGRLYLQVECERPDVYTNKMGKGRGGKYYLSEHMTESELARLMLGMLLAYEEHECREWFKIDNIAPFGPHIHLDALLEAATHLDFRE